MKDLKDQLEARVGKSVLTNEPLAKHVNFRIGGPADYFFLTETNEDLVHICQAAHELHVPYFLLGGGSNILVLDKGIRGLVIKMGNKEMSVNRTEVVVDSGFVLMDLTNKTAQSGLAGLEFGTGIYGTVGGAVRGNAGSYGTEIKDVLVSCDAFVPGRGVVHFTNEDCKFEYRGSIFKHHPEMAIIKATFGLHNVDAQTIKATIREIAQKKYGAQPMRFPSSGCIFKNPTVSPGDFKRIKKFLPDFETKNFWQTSSIGAGYLIEQAGLKGKQIGGAQVSEQHASFIINKDKATAEDVIMLISYVKQQVRDRFGIQLTEEVQIIGEY